MHLVKALPTPRPVSLLAEEEGRAGFVAEMAASQGMAGKVREVG